MLAELVVSEPPLVWSAARQLAGKYAPLLAKNPAIGVASAAGLPVATAGRLDLNSPIWGLLLDHGKGALAPAVAVAVTSGRELVAELSTGKAPLFRVQSNQGALTRLEPTKADRRQTLVVIGNLLIVGRGNTDAAARYLADVVAKRPAPKKAVLLRAEEPQLKGPVSGLLKAAWLRHQEQLTSAEQQARRQRGGRKPDFGEPQVIRSALSGGVDAALALVDSSRSFSASLAVGKAYWTLDIELEPLASGAASDLVRGQASGSALPVGELPASTGVAVLMRSSKQGRLEAARQVSEQLKALLAERVTSAEFETLTASLAHFASGRDELGIWGLMVGEAAGLFATGDLADSEAFHASISALPSALRTKAIRDPVSDLFGSLHVTESKSSLGGVALSGYRLTFGAGGRFAGVSRSGLEFLWQASNERYYVGVSAPPAKPLMEQLLQPKQRLGELGTLAGRLRALEAVSFAMVARPALLGLLPASPRPGADAPVLLGAGRRGKHGFVSVELPVEVVRSYAETMVVP